MACSPFPVGTATKLIAYTSVYLLTRGFPHEKCVLLLIKRETCSNYSTQEAYTLHL